MLDITQAGKSADRMQTQVFQLHYTPSLVSDFLDYENYRYGL